MNSRARVDVFTSTGDTAGYRIRVNKTARNDHAGIPDARL